MRIEKTINIELIFHSLSSSTRFLSAENSFSARVTVILWFLRLRWLIGVFIQTRHFPLPIPLPRLQHKFLMRSRQPRLRVQKRVLFFCGGRYAKIILTFQISASLLLFGMVPSEIRIEVVLSTDSAHLLRPHHLSPVKSRQRVLLRGMRGLILVGILEVVVGLY